MTEGNSLRNRNKLYSVYPRTSIYWTVGIPIFKKYNEAITKTAPYMATTCKGLVFYCLKFRLRPLNYKNGNSKKSSFHNYYVRDFARA